MASIVWGIDIGTSAIKVAKGRRSGGVIEVLDFDIAEIPFDEDEATRPERVKSALAALIARKNIGRTPVYVSVPGNQTFFRPFQLPAVEEKRVPEIVQYEARQQIPFPIDDILWGYQHQVTPEGEMLVRLVAVRRDDMNKLLTMLRSLGLNVEGLVAAPVALFNFAAYEYSVDSTTLVLDCGAKMTDFLVIEGGAFWFRPLTVGIEEMLRTLKQKFRISHEEAHKILFKMDQSKQAEKMFQVIEPVIRNLAGDIQRSLGYYKSLSHNVRVERVIGLGGAFRMPQIREYVGKMLGQDVDIPGKVAKFTAAPGLDAGWLNEEVGTMAIAFGLVAQGLGVARAPINLLPEEILHEKMVERKKPWAVAGVLAIIVAVVFSYVIQGKTTERYRADIEQADVIIKELNKYRQEYKQKAEGMAPIEERLKSYARIGRERPWFVDCLNKFNSTLVAVDPRGDLLTGPRPVIYVKQIFMSRYPESGYRTELEKDPDEVTEEGRPTRPGPPEFGPSGMGPIVRPAAGKVGEKKGDDPMMVVVIAEVSGEIGAAEAKIDPAFGLRDALQKVEYFNDPKDPSYPKPDLVGGWRPYQKLAMPRDKYLAEMEKKRRGEDAKILTRPATEFKMSWRYDDGTDVRSEASGAASGKM